MEGGAFAAAEPEVEGGAFAAPVLMSPCGSLRSPAPTPTPPALSPVDAHELLLCLRSSRLPFPPPAATISAASPNLHPLSSSPSPSPPPSF